MKIETIVKFLKDVPGFTGLKDTKQTISINEAYTNCGDSEDIYNAAQYQLEKTYGVTLWPNEDFEIVNLNDIINEYS